jgi:hypothetical protein
MYDSRMVTPPPVSGASYPTETASESRSNYLLGGLIFNTTYTNNLLGGASTKPISDISYSVWPTIELDHVTPRLHTDLTYSPGFTFYQHTSSYNQGNQNFAIDFRYRISPHLTFSLADSLHKLSNVFNQPDLLAATPVSGSAQSPTVAIVAPVADQLSNTGNVQLAYQFSRDAMVGASGTFTNLHYPNPAEVPGLYDSSSRGGSAFYSHRLSRKHYIGVTYHYSRISAYSVDTQSETQTHTIFAFYTIYLKPNLSWSLSGGPQHSETAQAPQPSFHSWSPAVSTSLGWQGRHATFAASYSRIVTGGGGLIGAFHSNTANASASWQIARTWNVGAAASYAIFKNLTPFFVSAYPGGHTVSGTISLRHQIGEHFNAGLGYTRLHQSYSGVPAVSTNPNTNREYVSISYQFTRPLGR